MFKYILLLITFCLSIVHAAEMIFPYQFPSNSALKIYVKSPFYRENVVKESKVPIPKLNEVLSDAGRFSVDGVVKVDNMLVAIVNGNLYKVNDKIDGGVVKEIHLNYIEVERNNKRDRFFVNSTK
ncbi:MAG: hypothetical protein LDL13_08155 [Calditerrivibrio sp.]|nr:hypothetical protein [Calditerrivibrio sp.]MCA1980567.1 hypothetical protein [Calditerrivibrio sp.]